MKKHTGRTVSKFRAWHTANKEITKVDVLDFSLEEIRVIEESGQTLSMGFKYVELMQSTGLKDKNGVEIFEGDIIKNLNTLTVGRVAWDLHNTGWYYSVRKKGNSLFEYYTLFRSKHNLEVIGNIYENAYLLEVEE